MNALRSFVLTLILSTVVFAQDSLIEPPLGLPLHLRVIGKKLLIVSHVPVEQDYVKNYLREKNVDYDFIEHFDITRKDYSDYYAIVAFSNSMHDYSKKPAEDFLPLEQFVREGGHLFLFASFNGDGFQVIQPLGIRVSYYHNASLKPVESRTKALTHGNEELIPEDWQARSYMNINPGSVQHVNMLVRGEGSYEGDTALMSCQFDKGRLSICSVEPVKASAWLMDIVLDWIRAGAPTTMDQVGKQAVVDPITWRERSGMQRLPEERIAELKKNLAADIAGAKAATILDKANAKEDAEEKFVLAMLASEEFAESGDANGAISTLAVMQNLFLIDRQAEQARLLALCWENCTSTDHAEDIARLCLDFEEEAVTSHRFEVAWKLLQTAKSAAKLCNHAHYQSLTENRIELLSPVYASYQRAASALKSWKANPDDPALNSTVGKFFAFVCNDWQIALPCLARGNDEELKELAELSLKEPESAIERIRIADRWSTYSDKLDGIERDNIKRRARFWYQQVQDEELSREDENRVQQFLANKESNSATLMITMSVDGYGEFHISPTEISWENKSGIEPTKIVVNDQSWDPRNNVLMNRGSTRFMPNDVGLEFCNLEVMSGRGVVRIQDADTNNVSVRVSDVPKGQGSYKFTISLGEQQ